MLICFNNFKIIKLIFAQDLSDGIYIRKVSEVAGLYELQDLIQNWLKHSIKNLQLVESCVLVGVIFW